MTCPNRGTEMRRNCEVAQWWKNKDVHLGLPQTMSLLSLERDISRISSTHMVRISAWVLCHRNPHKSNFTKCEWLISGTRIGASPIQMTVKHGGVPSFRTSPCVQRFNWVLLGDDGGTHYGLSTIGISFRRLLNASHSAICLSSWAKSQLPSQHCQVAQWPWSWHTIGPQTQRHRPHGWPNKLTFTKIWQGTYDGSWATLIDACQDHMIANNVFPRVS